MAKPTILLVDSDPRSQHVVELSLQKAGYDVVCIANGESALEAVDVRSVDLVLTDRNLLGLDGLAVLSHLKASARHAHVPVVLLTAERSIAERQRALELGAADYVIKPLAVRELLSRIEEVLEKAGVTRRAEETRSRDGRKTTSAPPSEGPDTKVLRTRFAGSTRDMAVVDLIQTFEVSRKTGEIRIAAGNLSGSIWIREGSVVDAEAGKLSGEDAVYRLLVLPDADFHVHFGPIERNLSIEASTAALLMEGLRRADEWHRLASELPELSSILRVEATRLVYKLSQIPDELNVVLRLCDGHRSIMDVLDASPFDDLSTLTTVAKLLAEGILSAIPAPIAVAESPPEPLEDEPSASSSVTDWTPRRTLRVPSGTLLAADSDADASELLASALTPAVPPVLLEPDPHDALTVPSPVSLESSPRTLPVPQLDVAGASSLTSDAGDDASQWLDPTAKVPPVAIRAERFEHSPMAAATEPVVSSASEVEATEPTSSSSESVLPQPLVPARLSGRRVVLWFASVTLGACVLVIAARYGYRGKYDTKEGLELRPLSASVAKKTSASPVPPPPPTTQVLPDEPVVNHAEVAPPRETLPSSAASAASTASMAPTKAVDAPRPVAVVGEPHRITPQAAASSVVARDAPPRASSTSSSPVPPAPAAVSSGVSAQAMTQEARKSLDGKEGKEGDDRQRTRAVQLAFLATQEDPTNAEAWLTLGAAYEAIGKKPQASESYRSCARRAASHPRVGECKARAGIKD
jgi:CheY-like chemotaxis protein